MGWYENGQLVHAGNGYTFTVDRNRALVARFSQQSGTGQVHDPERLREPKTKLEFIYCADEGELAAAKMKAKNDIDRLPDSIVDVIAIDQTGNEWMGGRVFASADEAVLALELGEVGYAATINVV